MLPRLAPCHTNYRSLDFYNGKDDQPLKIAMRFDDRNILSFDSTWVDYRGKERHGLNLNGSYANGDARDKYVSASIGPDRRMRENPASSQWTILGRMLMYGKEASNRKQEIDRQHYTIPNQRPKDKHFEKI